MAGIAAGFGAVFGTPLAGAIFALEVLTIGRVEYEALLPCLVAALAWALLRISLLGRALQKQSWEPKPVVHAPSPEERALADARSGHTSLVLLHAAPGLGRSALLAHFLATLESTSPTTVVSATERAATGSSEPGSPSALPTITITNWPTRTSAVRSRLIRTISRRRTSSGTMIGGSKPSAD